MNALRKIGISLLALLSLSFGVNAQNNLDLLSGKELAEMSRLNPAFTSIVNELRAVSSASGELNLGFEGKLFKTPNHFGFYYQQNDIDNLRRNKIDFQLARDIDFKSGLQLKYAGQIQYSKKTFHRLADENFPINVFDYNGTEYTIDSSNLAMVQQDRQVFDIGLGVGGTFKNLIFGANVRHLNQPDVSILGGTEDKLDIELSAQVGGFMNLGEMSLFPHLIYAQQGADQFISGGIGVTRKNVTFMGQYEQLGDQTQLDLGLNFRYNRFMVGVNYVYPQVDNYQFNLSDIRFTVNTTIRKPRIQNNELLNKLRYLY